MKKEILRSLVGIFVAALVGCATSSQHGIPPEVRNQNFAAGDSIVVDGMVATSPHLKIGDTVTVRGRYRLRSEPDAILGVSLTKTGPSGPTQASPQQRMAIVAGEGFFELSLVIAAKGSLHVSFTPRSGGSSFGNVYFGPMIQ